jgi:hypothetical protein
MNQSNNDLDSKMDTQIDFTTPATRFSVKNDDELNNGVAYFKENGYAVFSNIMDQDEVNINKDLLWKFLESASSGLLQRDKPDTWSNPW